jgi:hypothetical protein
MAEPTTTTAAGLAAALSATTLALLGVDYYSLLYGMVGAMSAAMAAQALPWVRMLILVALSTLVGAILGNAAVALLGSTNGFLLKAGCIVAGFGAQPLLAKIVCAAMDRIGIAGRSEGGK